jgi:hypothetical protein
MKDRIPVIRNTLRNDLLDRIKDRHMVWWNDSMDLYRMAGLKPSAFGNDVLSVLTFQICWMLEHYKIDTDTFVKSLRAARKAYGEIEE